MEGLSEVVGSEKQRGRGLKSLEIAGVWGAGTIKCMLRALPLEACSTAPRAGINSSGRQGKETAEELAD